MKDRLSVANGNSLQGKWYTLRRDTKNQSYLWKCLSLGIYISFHESVPKVRTNQFISEFSLCYLYSNLNMITLVNAINGCHTSKGRTHEHWPQTEIVNTLLDPNHIQNISVYTYELLITGSHHEVHRSWLNPSRRVKTFHNCLMFKVSIFWTNGAPYSSSLQLENWLL